MMLIRDQDRVRLISRGGGDETKSLPPLKVEEVIDSYNE
jgi:hypothetical protein